MKKKISSAFGKTIYLLGQDSEGTNYWLEEGSFDCGWYWGIGYVETYTNNSNPQCSRDISSHQHFDNMFLGGNGFDKFKEFFTKTPFDDKEIWKILEIMMALYTARRYSDMIHRGGANYTKNPLVEVIKSDKEYLRINEVVIPRLLEELYKILGGS